VLVAGALGVVGRAVIEHCWQRSDIDVVGLSRRVADIVPGCAFLSTDLLDRAACERTLAHLTDVTDIVFAAWLPARSRDEEVAPNLAMLRNLVEAMENISGELRYVGLMQGIKAYGAQFGAFSTPARETDARHPPPHFYYAQQDYLAGRKKRRWTWTAFRPPTVLGRGFNSVMDPISSIGVYAAVSRELGLPLRFPGQETGYNALRDAVDADLLARAILWAGEHAECDGEVFNVANGDQFRWRQMWPHIAAIFGMTPGEPHTLPLADFMSAHAETWQHLATRHGLVPQGFITESAWRHLQRILNFPDDRIVNTLKMRKFGFQDFEDTYSTFERVFTRLKAQRILPP